jgi:hypothetical protein
MTGLLHTQRPPDFLDSLMGGDAFRFVEVDDAIHKKLDLFRFQDSGL